MGKDRLRPLYKHLGEGNVSAAVNMGDRLIRELEDEIAAGRKQIGVLREILAPYKDSIAQDGLTSSQRGELVRQAAFTLVDRGYTEITPPDVEAYLKDEMQIVLDVQRPASVIGTVLAKAKEFDRVATGRFKPNSLAARSADTSSKATSE